MTRPALAPAAALRRYVTICALFWLPLGLTIAPLILLFTERGIPMAAIAGFFAVHSLTAAALELPTGGLSDVLGRRAVLATAGLLNLAALTLVALGTAPWLLVLGMALLGTGRALSSGPAEAWYVDTVRAHSGPGADLRTGLARGSSATSAALAAGTLLGGALPWLTGLVPGLGAGLAGATAGLVVPLCLPLLLGAAVEAAFVSYVVTSLPEPPRPKATLRHVLRDVPATVAGGLRLGGRDALVRRVFLSAGAAGGAVAAIELLTPRRAAGLTGAAESGPCSSPPWPAPDSSARPSAATSHRWPPGSRGAASAPSCWASAPARAACSCSAPPRRPPERSPWSSRPPATAWSTSGSGRRARARTRSCTAASPTGAGPPHCPSSPSHCNWPEPWPV